MTINDVPRLTRYLLEQHGLWGKGWRFRWDHAKRRAGGCHHGRKVISLSRHYVALNVAGRSDDIVDTILHEIAHALCGPHEGHGAAWKATCVRIGARPQRCYDSATVEMPKGRLVAKCGWCGREYRRHKQVKAGWRCFCRHCGNERGVLVFKDPEAAPLPPPSIADQVRAANAAHDVPPPPQRLR